MKQAQYELHADIEDRHWWFLGRRRIMRELVRRTVPPAGPATIIDVGCGTGANIAALSQDYSCIGIDSSEEAIQFAKRRFPHVQFVVGHVPGNLASSQDQASLFLLMDVLEHVPDDFAFLSEFLAATKPGTYLLLTVPADLSLWSEHDVSFGHYRRYDIRRLEQLWSGLPVTPCLLSYYNARLYPIIKMTRTFNRWRGRTSGVAGTDFSMPSRPLNKILAEILAGEAKVLLNTLDGKQRQGFSRGVSLIALLRREHGEIEPREMSGDTAPGHQESRQNEH